MATIGSVLAFVEHPARAVGGTAASDADGVDYDAGCIHDTRIAPRGPNGVASPGTAGKCTVSTYDNSTEGLDLKDAVAAVALSSDASGHLVAQFEVDGTVPAAGSTNKAAYDLPDSNFVGGNYFALFQNKTMQTLAKYTACPQFPPRPWPMVQRFGTWRDGYHFFVAFSVIWDGFKWIHSARIGEYDPSPTGGLKYFELGTDNGGGWVNANPYHTVGTGFDQFNVDISVPGTIKVTAPAVYKDPDTINCSNGHFDYWFAKSGDVIANVKGLTAADRGDGYAFFSDTTAGNSTAGLMNSNIVGIAYTTGSEGRAGAPLTEMMVTEPCHVELETTCPGGSYEPSDTYGPGPTCPYPTHGGTYQENPLWTVDTACHDDDDPISRGSFRPEFWNTPYGFLF